MTSFNFEDKLSFLENEMTIIELRLSQKERKIIAQKKNDFTESYEIARKKWAEYIFLKSKRLAADKGHQKANRDYESKSREHSILLQQVPIDANAAKKTHAELNELKDVISNKLTEKLGIENEISLLIGKKIDEVNEENIFSKHLLDAVEEAHEKYNEAVIQFTLSTSSTS